MKKGVGGSFNNLHCNFKKFEQEGIPFESLGLNIIKAGWRYIFAEPEAEPASAKERADRLTLAFQKIAGGEAVKVLPIMDVTDQTDPTIMVPAIMEIGV